MLFLGSLGCKKKALETKDGVDSATSSSERVSEYTDFFREKIRQEFERKDSGEDGWDTEVFHESAKKVLSSYGKVLSDVDDVEFSDIMGKVATKDSTATELYPQSSVSVFADSALRVRRHSGSGTQRSFTQATKDLAASLKGDARKIFFKIYRVKMTEEEISTHVIVHFTSSDGKSVSQQNAVWKVKWELPKSEGTPKIKEVEVDEHEEINAQWSEGELFTDCVASLIPSGGAAQEQLSTGLFHWSQRIAGRLGVSPPGYYGLSLGDVNGDLLDDLYLSQTGGLPNRLFIQQDDGSLMDYSVESRTAWLTDTRCSLFADLDNDGDQDLAVVTTKGLVFMENDGAGHFTAHPLITTTGDPFSLTAADPDQDGDLDLYLCIYGGVWGGLGDAEHHVPLPMHDASNGGPNMLLLNDGNWGFSSVTDQVGLDQNNTRWSLSSAWADYDQDGDDDLYVANDFGRNNLYRNDTDENGILRFTDVAASLGVEDISPGMSASWGDPNNDGKMDLYISNMFSGAGNRITYQKKFQTGSQTSRAGLQRMSKGNSFYLNPASTGSEHFADFSERSRTTVGKWAWASRFADMNNNGFEDVMVANGFITVPDDSGDL